MPVDISHNDDGLLRLTFDGALNASDFRGLFDYLASMADENDTDEVATLIDGRNIEIGSIGSEERAAIIEGVKRLQGQVQDRHIAQAFVLRSVFARNFVRMIMMLVRDKKPQRTFRDPEAAEQWCSEILKRRSSRPPALH